MRIIILFGGGDAGGWIIGPDGIEPIPPFDPGVIVEIGAISRLATIGPVLVRMGLEDQIAPTLDRLLSKNLDEVFKAAGGDVAGMAFFDADGGFFCGSTGRKPIPLPWPKRFFAPSSLNRALERVG